MLNKKLIWYTYLVITKIFLCNQINFMVNDIKIVYTMQWFWHPSCFVFDADLSKICLKDVSLSIYYLGSEVMSSVFLPLTQSRLHQETPRTLPRALSPIPCLEVPYLLTVVQLWHDPWTLSRHTYLGMYVGNPIRRQVSCVETCRSGTKWYTGVHFKRDARCCPNVPFLP